MKSKRNLSTLKYIPYDNSFSLMDYANNYSNTLHETVYELDTEIGKIPILFLERHLPHIIGLHHFIDKNSRNILLRKYHNLSGEDGFNNIIEGNITFDDLQKSQGGKIWKNKKAKKRILSMHLIPDMINNSSLYLVDGALKGDIKAKYILKSTVDHTCFSLCIDEDLKMNRLDIQYCCVSNLIDDNKVNKMIEEKKLKPIKLYKIIKKEYYRGRILEIVCKMHIISSDNPYYSTKNCSIECINELLKKNCTFKAIYNPSSKNYEVSYLEIDITTRRVLDKY